MSLMSIKYRQKMAADDPADRGLATKILKRR
jgi:hypothetical protein